MLVLDKDLFILYKHIHEENSVCMNVLKANFYKTLIVNNIVKITSYLSFIFTYFSLICYFNFLLSLNILLSFLYFHHFKYMNWHWGSYLIDIILKASCKLQY
jgi:hypothetical protein